MALFKEGQSVKVRKGINCPEVDDLLIEGWQGRIYEVTEDEDGMELVGIDWDSQTLRSMPEHFIYDTDSQEPEYPFMYLYAEEIEPAEARDTVDDVVAALEELEKKYPWAWAGKSGKLIQEMIDEHGDQEEGMPEKWEDYLKANLKFPFPAYVAEFQEKGTRMRMGDRVFVLRSSSITAFDGVRAFISHRGTNMDFPFCDLEIREKDHPNYFPLKTYTIWYANKDGDEDEGDED